MTKAELKIMEDGNNARDGMQRKDIRELIEAVRTYQAMMPGIDNAVASFKKDIADRVARIAELEAALKQIASAPTWKALTMSGTTIQHTYALATVDRAREVLAKKEGTP